MDKEDYITFKELLTGKVNKASSDIQLIYKKQRLKHMRKMLLFCIIAYVILFAIAIIGANIQQR